MPLRPSIHFKKYSWKMNIPSICVTCFKSVINLSGLQQTQRVPGKLLWVVSSQWCSSSRGLFSLRKQDFSVGLLIKQLLAVDVILSLTVLPHSLHLLIEFYGRNQGVSMMN